MYELLLVDYVKTITEKAVARRRALTTHAKAKLECNSMLQIPEPLSAGHKKQPKSELVSKHITRFAKRPTAERSWEETEKQGTERPGRCKEQKTGGKRKQKQCRKIKAAKRIKLRK